MKNNTIDFEARNKKMMDDVIHKFGNEARETIHFCKTVEKYPAGWLPGVEYCYFMKKWEKILTFSKKIFQKGIDKSRSLWYNMYVR